MADMRKNGWYPPFFISCTWWCLCILLLFPPFEIRSLLRRNLNLERSNFVSHAFFAKVIVPGSSFPFKIFFLVTNSVSFMREEERSERKNNFLLPVPFLSFLPPSTLFNSAPLNWDMGKEELLHALIFLFRWGKP